MKTLSTNPETLNKFKIQNSNVSNIRTFAFRACLDSRNSYLGFTPERSF
jgi:hypothetical protein